MCTEIRRLRYCYNVLRKRIDDEDEGLAYWQMNLKIATYFLQRYDDEFDPESCYDDEELLDAEEDSTLRTHALLQRPSSHRRSYPSLTKDLEQQLKEKVAKYFESIEKPDSTRKSG